MDLRHVRCFLTVAEELRFAHSAERLHIDQSPLSRAIKELKEGLNSYMDTTPIQARVYLFRKRTA